MSDKHADDDRPILEIVADDEPEPAEPGEPTAPTAPAGQRLGGPPEPDRRADPRHRGPW